MDKVEINHKSFVTKIENVFLAVSNRWKVITRRLNQKPWI